MSLNIQLKRYNGSADVIIHPETNWGQVQDKPTTFTPTSHSHNIGDLPSDLVVDGDVTETATASKIMKRNPSGYAFATIFNQTYSSNNTNIGNFMTQISAADGYIRPTSLASAKTAIVTKAAVEAVLTGAITTHTHSYLPLTGTASKATILATARTIGGVSFNGSANINLPGVNTTGTQNTTGKSQSVDVVTTCPTAINSNGYRFYKGSTDCATKYAGWIYLITG